MVSTVGAKDGNGVTVPEVRAEVARILGNADAEAAHWDEDRLLEAFVRHVAAGRRMSPAIAAELVVLLDADRTRWYA